MRRVALVLIGLLAPAAAHAEMRLPPGFTVEVYVTGRGEAPDGRAAVGIPSTTSLAFDAAGALYMLPAMAVVISVLARHMRRGRAR